jgi:ADP-ribose pyrophosphatase YjhB (NUDIX family)
MLSPISPFKLPLPPVDSYAQPATGNPSPRLRLYQTQPKGVLNPWYFVHRENAPQGGVGMVTIIENDKGEQFVHLLKLKRPPLGGKVSIELPAGLIGDQGKPEDPLETAKREVREETGYTVSKARLLTPHNVATAQGISSEIMTFALALVKAQKRGVDMRQGSEKTIIIGKMNVPIQTFADPAQFSNWVQAMNKEGYILSKEVFIARAMLPTLKNGKLPESAFEATA